MEQIDARSLLEHLHRQMVLAAVAARRVRKRRIGPLRELDEFLEALHRKLRVHGEDELIRRHGVDRREIAQRVERHAAVEVRVDGDLAVGQQPHGMAVGRRLRHQLRRDVAVRARAVLHHHRLAERLGKLLREHACRDVGCAPGRNRNDEAERARRKLSECGAARCHERQEKEGPNHVTCSASDLGRARRCLGPSTGLPGTRHVCPACD